MADSKTLHNLLKQYWGHDKFRDKQEEIIQSVLAKKDTLALLPTGGGKSICFQLPAMVLEGICLVVSPLVALMQDQVDTLRKKGIKALAITSAMSRRELDIALDNAAYGDYKFLYVSPERIETELFQARFLKMNVNLIAIDEAHCISQWGYDFRPAYLNIAKLRKLKPEATLIALTATATVPVVDDIQEKLEFKTKNCIRKSFERKNIAYVVQKTENQLERLLQVLAGVQGAGLVYVGSRKRSKYIAQYLNEHRISADFYHAGLDFQTRINKQQDWIANRTRIIVATNAFGMGIDKADVRLVVHLDAPESLEAYFQEAGRGGRDEDKAFAVFLVNPSMSTALSDRVSQKFPPINEIKKTYLALCNYLQVPIDGGLDQLFSLDLARFSKEFKLNINQCYQSLVLLAKDEYIHLSENFAQASRVHITVGKEDLYKFQVSNKKHDHFLKTLLRTYGGLFEGFVKINENQLAKNTGLPLNELINTLKRLEELEILDYEARTNLPKISFTKPRLDQRSLIISKSVYLDRKKIAKEKIDAVIQYIETESQCRSQILLSYFGEENAKPCGHCDVCLANKKPLKSNQKVVKSELLSLLIGREYLLMDVYKALAQFTESEIQDCLEQLLDSGEVKLIDGLVSLK